MLIVTNREPLSTASCTADLFSAGCSICHSTSRHRIVKDYSLKKLSEWP